MVARSKLGGSWPPSNAYHGLSDTHRETLKDSNYYFRHRNRNVADLTRSRNSICRYFTRPPGPNDVEDNSESIDAMDTRNVSENFDNNPNKIEEQRRHGDYYMSIWEKSLLLMHRRGIPYEISTQDPLILNRYILTMAKTMDEVYFNGTLLPSLEPISFVSDMRVFDLSPMGNGMIGNAGVLTARLADCLNPPTQINVYWNTIQDPRFHLGTGLPHNACSFPGPPGRRAFWDGRYVDSMLATVANIIQHELVHAVIFKHCASLDACRLINHHNLTFNDMSKTMWGRGTADSFQERPPVPVDVADVATRSGLGKFYKVGRVKIGRLFTSGYLKARRIQGTTMINLYAPGKCVKTRTSYVPQCILKKGNKEENTNIKKRKS